MRGTRLLLSFADPPFFLVDHVVNVQRLSCFHACPPLCAFCLYRTVYAQIGRIMPVLWAAEQDSAPLAAVKQGEAQQNLVKQQPYHAAQQSGDQQQGLPAASVFFGNVS